MKKIKKLIGFTAASAMMSLGSCISEIEAPASPDNDKAAPMTVCFSLGGSAAIQSRAEIQSSDEKKLESLYAVVFYDADEGSTSGAQNQIDNRDTFCRLFSLLPADGHTYDEGTNFKDDTFEFRIGEPGTYNVCFVANPGDALETSLQGLTPRISKISDFKAFVEDQAPETKPGMTMVSKFYGIKIDEHLGAELGVVPLNRIMARVDIYNEASSVKITSIEFGNRTTRSSIWRDYSTLNTDFLETQEDGKGKVYTPENPLEVTKDPYAPGVYAAEIYTYEQYGTPESGYAPYLKLTYTVVGKDGDEGTTTDAIYFKDQDGNVLNIQRNHLYRLHVRQLNGTIQFFMTVADWNEGDPIDIPYGDLALGADEWNVDEAVTKLVQDYLASAEENIDKYLAQYREMSDPYVGDLFLYSEEFKDGKLMPNESLANAVDELNNAKRGISAAISAMNLPEIAKNLITEKMAELVAPVALKVETRQKACIGIVAYRYSDPKDDGSWNYGTWNSEGVGQALKDKGVNTPHALVMALKNAGYMSWSNHTTYCGYGNKELSHYAQYVQNDDGLSIQKKIIAANHDLNNSNHPAYYSAKNYIPKNLAEGLGSCPAKTTGWYLPSQPEWMNILGGTGIGACAQVDTDVKQNTGQGGRNSTTADITDAGKNIAKTINAKLKVVENAEVSVDYFRGNIDGTQSNQDFWTSSEWTETNTYFWSIANNLGNTSQSKSKYKFVRAVFAF